MIINTSVSYRSSSLTLCFNHRAHLRALIEYFNISKYRHAKSILMILIIVCKKKMDETKEESATFSRLPICKSSEYTICVVATPSLATNHFCSNRIAMLILLNVWIHFGLLTIQIK